MPPPSSSLPLSLAITWLGHSTFLLRLPSGQRVVTDPWLGNPQCPGAFSSPDRLALVDLMLVSHDHDDHAADVIPVARASGAAVACQFETGERLVARGVRNVRQMNIGGTIAIDGLRVTMTPALHSGGAGFILRAPDMPTIYFAGDTAVSVEMKAIAELYRPVIAFLPIGDVYTMGPDTAAVAARWLGVRQVVPMHWGTFPVLTGTPSELRAHLDGTGIDVLELRPGETAE